jgi:hypothetical protein
MILILSLFACIKTPESSNKTMLKGFPTVAVLELEDGVSSIPVELQQAINSHLQNSDLTLIFYDVPAEFATTKKADERLALFTQDQLLLIESKAVFFSQLSGRYRWETSFAVHLLINKEIKSTHLDIPVFLVYHHQREADALLEAEALLLRELELFLNENLGK